mgnify:CR=1 FL=1|jgi:hypothetical protein
MFLKIKVTSEYKNIANDIYHAFIVLFVMHIVMSMHYNGKAPPSLGLSGGLFNDGFIITLSSLYLGIFAYELVFKKLVVFI